MLIPSSYLAQFRKANRGRGYVWHFLAYRFHGDANPMIHSTRLEDVCLSCLLNSKFLFGNL